MSTRQEKPFEEEFDSFFGEGEVRPKGNFNDRHVVNNTTPLDPNDFEDPEKFSYIMSSYTTYNDLHRVLSVMQYIAALKLAGQVSKALSDTEGYLAMIADYSDIQEEERFGRLDGMLGVTKVNRFEGLSKSVWDAGKGAVDCGATPTKFHSQSGLGKSVKDLCEVKPLVKDAFAKKTKQLDNAINSIVSVFPLRTKRLLTTSSAKFTAVMDLVQAFDAGTVNVALDAKSYSNPNEAGVTLPHTLDSKEWIGSSVARLMNDQYSFGAVSFRTEDMQDVRYYDGAASSYILISEKEDSPLHITRSPSIYLAPQGGQWGWRSAISQAQSMASLEIERDASLLTQRDQLVTHSLVGLADEFVSVSSTSVEFSATSVPCVSRVLGEYFGKKFVFHFYKRGYSTKVEAQSITDCIHIVKDTIAKEFSPSDYFPISLGDIQTVVLMPADIWAKSNHARSSTDRFNTAFGSAYTTMFDSFKLLFSLYRLSHVKNMFDSWSMGVEYDQVKHGEKLREIAVSNDPGMIKLFNNMAPDRRGKLLAYANVITQSSLSGLWISPGVSKVGKSTIKEISKGSGFDQMIMEFGDVRVSKTVRFEDIDFGGPVRGRSFESRQGEEVDKTSPKIVDITAFDE